MAKLKTGTKIKKKINGIVKLKIVVQKLQKSLSLGRRKSRHEEVGEASSSCCVPEDGKEGHFAVDVVDGGDEPKRFVVPLTCLTHPTFLRLLEQAAEDYGFDHEGDLTIPCRPSKLERILADGGSDVEVNWGSCKTMVQSYRSKNMMYV
ncbi:auxin-responsive protein SAUR50 [Corylus avellana]|uniref:auxin-responsive protein SAUR50 n=1 Tax=Corylus avellana TaxID=13451 RepID=UPI00286B4FC7|nr:auxin-responsive protein SAUR50 [Corylus avellana]